MKCLFMLPFRYKSAVRFSIGSTAELLETDLVVARDNKTVMVVTPFDVKEPMLELSPGKGVKCGQLVCHKYASCSVKFVNGEEAKCNCPPGFSGNHKSWNYFLHIIVHSWFFNIKGMVLMNAIMKNLTSLTFLLLLLPLIANCMAVELMLNANTSQQLIPLFAFVKKDMRY